MDANTYCALVGHAGANLTGADEAADVTRKASDSHLVAIMVDRERGHITASSRPTLSATDEIVRIVDHPVDAVIITLWAARRLCGPRETATWGKAPARAKEEKK